MKRIIRSGIAQTAGRGEAPYRIAYLPGGFAAGAGADDARLGPRLGAHPELDVHERGRRRGGPAAHLNALVVDDVQVRGKELDVAVEVEDLLQE